MPDLQAANTAAYNFQTYPLTKIIESPTNPRHIFDPKKLAELAESIKAHGVLEPLLVRIKKEKAELISGARRFRAAKLAGNLAELPVRILDLTDDQVLEVQLIENLQREDVQPLEEAEGYARLLKVDGYTATMIADKIGKNESYVYRRIRLSKLIPKLKVDLETARITVAHADLLCPLEAATQEAIRKDNLYNTWPRASKGELQAPITPSELRRIIRDEVMLSLAAAPWKKDDALLLPAAGPCTTCPKRSGANLALFDDLKKGDDRCLDLACYTAKRTAFVRIELTVAKAVDKPLIAIQGGYISRDDAKHAPKDIGPVVSHNDFREAGSKKCPHVEEALVVSGQGIGQRKKICRHKGCRVHDSYGYRSPVRSKAAVWKEKREQLDRKLVLDSRAAAVAKIVEKVKALDAGDMLLIGQALIEHLDRDQENAASHLLGVDLGAKKTGYEYGANRKLLREGYDGDPGDLVGLALIQHVQPPPSYMPKTTPDLLATWAKHHKVDLAAIHKEMSAEALKQFNKKRAAAMKAKPAKKAKAKKGATK